MLGVPDPSAEPGLFGGVSDNYNVSYHGYSHSHIDSLCHILYRGKMYNGVSHDTITEDGCSNASIVNLQGGIVTRGVLLDFPRLKACRTSSRERRSTWRTSRPGRRWPA